MQRDTPQRQIIRQVLEHAQRPLSPPEVLRDARVQLPRVGIATVYRTLRLLVNEGWAVQLDLPGEAARFERKGLNHRYYFCCRTCGKLFEFDGCALRQDLALPPGFVIEEHKVIFYGRCPACSQKKQDA